MDNLRVIIAGGGTGGHIFPAVAVGHALRRLRPGTQLLFVGAAGKMEMEKVPLEGFEIVGLDIKGFNRQQLWKNIVLPYKLLKSRWEARRILKIFQPHAVVGVGGYASFPVLQAAQGLNIPTLIQEQNSFAGKSNTILARKASAVCVAYANMEKFFPAEKITITGNPVRKEISTMDAEPIAAKQAFGLNPELKTVLVIGGSQGAKSINEAIDAGLDRLLAAGVQVVWQTGKPYFEQARMRAADFGAKVIVVDFIREMASAYAVADVVVSRAGALAIAELCIVAKPVIFVPYPFAAEDHQTSNAMAVVVNRGAMMIDDNEVKNIVVDKLIELLGNDKMQADMSTHLKQMAIKDADDRIANKVISIANQAI
ncbi:MAG: undecaprenyldiphospho-muramoylpentapeptide beta-N-acetylglucosaminyltransferase [Taibaiella sp.]|nr:undecaprenyldiphospho-muramoylpentapeptide beta-N-acetylglucosaminyltransferase [Taibaiella sp.]